MNRFCYALCTLVLLLCALPAQAQVDVGVVGALNYATLSGEDSDGDKLDFSSRMLFGAGLVLDYHFNEFLSLRTEPTYLQKGADQTETDFDGAWKSSFVEVPLFLKYSLDMGEGMARPYVMAGASVGYCLDAELEIDAGAFQGTYDAMDIAEHWDFGLDFGAGMNFQFTRFSLFFEGRYDLGITDVTKGGVMLNNQGEELDVSGSKVYTRGLQAAVGITMPLTLSRR